MFRSHSWWSYIHNLFFLCIMVISTHICYNTQIKIIHCWSECKIIIDVQRNGWTDIRSSTDRNVFFLPRIPPCMCLSQFILAHKPYWYTDPLQYASVVIIFIIWLYLSHMTLMVYPGGFSHTGTLMWELDPQQWALHGHIPSLITGEWDVLISFGME